MLSQLCKYAYWFWLALNGKRSSSIFHILLKSIFSIAKQSCPCWCLSGSLCLLLQSDWESREGHRGQHSIYSISSWNRQIVHNQPDTWQGLLRVHFIRVVIFHGLPADWWKADLIPREGSTLIINNKDGPRKSITGPDLDLFPKN